MGIENVLSSPRRLVGVKRERDGGETRQHVTGEVNGDFEGLHQSFLSGAIPGPGLR
jgi:hypothetical protein